MGFSPGSDIELTGATDGTNIGNVGDRLKVDVSASPVPKTDVRYFSRYLLNGASSDMIVNGSGTNVNFTYTPTTTVYIHKLFLVMADDNIKNRSRFGDITITNGVRIRASINASVNEIINLITNPEIGEFFDIVSYYTNELGADKPIVYASYTFDPVITLSNATSDYIQATVRDNLTGLKYFKMRVSGWLEV